jgi:hypothetical protein
MQKAVLVDNQVTIGNHFYFQCITAVEEYCTVVKWANVFVRSIQMNLCWDGRGPIMWDANFSALFGTVL